ncbi:MAG: glycosyltransferase family 2 protein, partial [Candidatus Hodarchaeota archaeon]
MNSSGFFPPFEGAPSQTESLKKFIAKYRPFIAVVIPGYNEAQKIGIVINNVKKYSDKIIVVDDGSRDQTATVAATNGAHVVRHSRNQGKGRALRTGFKAALEDETTRYIFTMDADNQHCPDDIPTLLAVLLQKKADIVVGKRVIFESQDQFMPIHRLGSNFVTSTYLRIFIGFKIKDVQCG